MNSAAVPATRTAPAQGSRLNQPVKVRLGKRGERQRWPGAGQVPVGVPIGGQDACRTRVPLPGKASASARTQPTRGGNGLRAQPACPGAVAAAGFGRRPGPGAFSGRATARGGGGPPASVMRSIRLTPGQPPDSLAPCPATTSWGVRGRLDPSTGVGADRPVLPSSARRTAWKHATGVDGCVQRPGPQAARETSPQTPRRGDAAARMLAPTSPRPRVARPELPGTHEPDPVRRPTARRQTTTTTWRQPRARTRRRDG